MGDSGDVAEADSEEEGGHMEDNEDMAATVELEVSVHAAAVEPGLHRLELEPLPLPLLLLLLLLQLDGFRA